MLLRDTCCIINVWYNLRVITLTASWARWRYNSLASRLCSTVCSGADQRKRQSSASLTIVRRTSAYPPAPPQRSSNAENVTIWLSYHANTQIHRLSLIIPASSLSLGISYTLSTFYFITDNLPQYTSFIYPETELVCTGTIYRFTCHWMAESSKCAVASLITVI